MRWRAFLQHLYLHTSRWSVICPKVGNFIIIAVRTLTSTFTNCMLLSSSLSSPSSPSFIFWLFSFLFFLYLSLILLTTHFSFFLWSKFLNQHSMLHLCTTLLTVTWYVLLSTAETFSTLKRKNCQRSCTYLLKQDLSARQIHSLFTAHETSSPTSVQRSKVNDTAFVVSVVLCQYFTKFDITKVQNSCQDTIHCIHFIIMKSQKTEACIQLVVPLHVCL